MNISRRAILIMGALVAHLVVSGNLAAEDGHPRRVDEIRKRLETLRSVPYTMVTKAKVDTTISGVTVYEKDAAWKGYNLYCGRTRSEVVLIDMDGNVVNRWTHPADRAYVWDHAIMLDNGDVVVIRKHHDLLRLDWHSNVVWSSDIEVHHDVIQSPDSSFYAAVRESEDYRGMRINFPAIVRLSPDGQELHRWKSFANLDEIRDRFDPRLLIDTLLDSLLAEARTMSPETAEAFLASARSGPMPWGRRTDQFHLNTISILPDTPVGRRDGRFRMGNLLICFRNLNQIAVLDQDTWELLWTWGADDLDWPHLPVMLESGRILVFDNGTHRVYSRLIEVNPVTEKIEWEYVGEPHRAFFTPEKGSAQRLPNGNTLVCEGDMGRSFEVTRDGRIVWEWFNPVSQKGHREQIYRMWRIAPEVVEPLLERYDRR